MTDPALRPRRGAHRAPRSRLSTLAPLIGVLVILAVAVSLVRAVGGDDASARGSVTVDATPDTSATAPTPPTAVSEPEPTAPASTEPPPGAGPTSADAAAEAARSRFEVVVLNQTRREGLAASVAQTLRAAGWNVVSIGNFGGGVPATTVYFPAGGEAAAAEIATALTGAPRVLPVFPAIDAERLTVILTDSFP